jgi:subtilisin family serine protease
MYRRWVALAALVIGWNLFYGITATDASTDRPYRQGELLVQYKTGRPGMRRAALESSARAIRSQAIGSSRVHRVVLESGASLDQALAVYRKDPDVEFAEPNYLVRPQVSPGDFYYQRQWGLHNSGQKVNGISGKAGADLDAPAAWDISTGSETILVAVIDTGCDLNHPDLAANIWTNPGEIPGNGIDDDGNHYIDDIHGWDFSDQDNDPQDASGHGTHVAGIIGAEGDNENGVAGMAWRVQIMPLRFMNAFEEGTISDAIQAIDYALAMGARIINCSWGGSGYSRALQNVISNADALFICAAGNNAQDTDDHPFYPAALGEDNIISVAASDAADQLAGFSNFGPGTVDVAAPGCGIFSLGNSRRTLWTDNFDAGNLNNWTTGGSGDRWTAANPPSAIAGSALAVSSPDNYADNADTWALAPVQDLSTASATLLTMWITGKSETNADFLYLEASTDGAGWTNLPLQMGGVRKSNGISGPISFWSTARADLGPWDGRHQLFLRLRFKSDASESQSGFYIDELQLTAAGSQDNYQYMQGTSMAAAYVSGLAALILSEDAGLTPWELKFIIENSVDLKQNLLEKVASGGRVNAYNALTLLRELPLRATSAATDRIMLTWDSQASINSRVSIERRTEGQTDFETVAVVDADTRTFADSSLSADSTYYYRIQAETRDGRSGYSNQTLATTLSPGSSSAGGGSGGGGCFVAAVLQ